MNERLAKAEALFHEACELAPEEREAFLRQACGEDADLLREVRALLRASGIADQWLKDSDCAAGISLGSSPLDSLSEGPGTVVGRYKLLEKIGEGGFGAVYMAEQTEPVHRKVALKIIKLGMDTKSVIARFEAERQALALMDHPNIAKVLDAGATDTGRPYFVMELVRGVPMTRFCQENQLGTTERLELFIQVCGAIQHAHQKGVIHRDIKPTNVLVTLNDGVPYPMLIDFGVAKAINQRLTEKTLFTNFSQMIGTPAYMSPEQAEMSKLDVDTRSDIYSLGVLLYELLTGTTPFPEERLRSAGYKEMQRIICEEKPEKPSTKLTRAPLASDARRSAAKSPIKNQKSKIKNDLDWIVMKCLEKDRTRRYETANALAMDLRRHLSNEPVVARPPSKLYEFQKTVRRHRVGFAATVAIILVLVAGVLVSTWQAVRATHAQREALAAQAAEARLRERAQAAEKKAKTEAARSTAEAQFMKGMLNSVMQTVTLGRRTTSLDDILDQAAQWLGDVTYPPDVQADLCQTLGLLFSDLRDFPKAEPLLQKSLDLRRQLYGSENTSVVDAMWDLGHVLREEHKTRKAAADFREGLAVQRKLSGEENWKVARYLSGLAATLSTSKTVRDQAEAEADMREALAIERKLDTNGVLGTASVSLTQLGLFLAARGQRTEAVADLRESLQIRRRFWLGNQNSVDRESLVAEALDQLGMVLTSVPGHRAEAEALLREAVAMDKQLSDSRYTLAATMHLAFAVTNSLEAISLEREAADLNTRMHFGEGPAIATRVRDLSHRLLQLGKTNEAEATLRAALARAEKENPTNRIKFVYQYMLGDFLMGQKRYAEAEPLLRSAYLGLQQPLPSNEPLPDAVTARRSLLELYHAAGQQEKALALLHGIAESGSVATINKVAWTLATSPTPELRDGSNAVVMAEKAVAMTSRTNASCLDTLAAAYAEVGRFTKAIRVEQEAIPLLTNKDAIGRSALRLKIYESGSPYRDEGALAKTVRTQLQHGSFAEVEPGARECLRLCEKFMPDNWHTSEAQSMLGGSLLGQNKYAAAESLLLSGYEGLKQRESRIPADLRATRLKQALDQLVQLYQATGEKEKAAEWKKKLDDLNSPSTP